MYAGNILISFISFTTSSAQTKQIVITTLSNRGRSLEIRPGGKRLLFPKFKIWSKTNIFLNHEQRRRA